MGANADNDNNVDSTATDKAQRTLTPAAQRALAEAEERRRNERKGGLPVEIGGRGGADPARFGDWEINGRSIDF